MGSQVPQNNQPTYHESCFYQLTVRHSQQRRSSQMKSADFYCFYCIFFMNLTRKEEREITLEQINIMKLPPDTG